MRPHWLRFLKYRLDLYLRWYCAFGAREGLRIFRQIHVPSGNDAAEVLRLTSRRLLTPIHLRRGTSDIAAFEKIFVWKQYALSPCLQPATVKAVLDCGGNCGLSAVWFATHYPDAKVIVLEPEPRNFDLLVRNTGAFENVFPLQAAVSNRLCSLRIENPDAAPDSYRCVPCADALADSIPAYDPESIRERFEVDSFDLVKIDIEGGECDLFSQDCSRWLNRTRTLIIEIHGPEARRNVENAMPRNRWQRHVLGENDCFVNLAS
jgi:FkbM family methyltransferase